MSARDDYSQDMSGPDEIGTAAGRPERSGTEAAAVTHFLAELRSLGETNAPPPTPELETVFAGASPIRPRRHYGRIVRRAALVAAAVIAGTVTAAANHTLPAPAQQVVSNVVNSVTPFHIRTTPPRPVVPAPSRRHDDSGTNDRSGTRDDRGGDREGSGAMGESTGSQEPTEPADDNAAGRVRASGIADHSAEGDQAGSAGPARAGESGQEGDG